MDLEDCEPNNAGADSRGFDRGRGFNVRVDTAFKILGYPGLPTIFFVGGNRWIILLPALSSPTRNLRKKRRRETALANFADVNIGGFPSA
jgi:hypothetical protein